MGLQLILLSAFLHLGNCYPVAGFPLEYEVGQTFQYSYTTDTVITDLGPSASTGQGVGFKFSASIELTPVWSGTGRLLVRLQINKPKIHSIARAQVARELQGLPRQPAFFVWQDGKVTHVYASEEDSTLAINIKKGIISLFQLKLDDGTHKEVDASGECTVSYAKSGSTITRTKADCQSVDTMGQFSTVHPVMQVRKSSSSQTVYTIKDDLIFSAKSQETLKAVLNIEQSVSSIVSMNQVLHLDKTSRGITVKASSVEEAIKSISKKQRLELYGMILGTTFEAAQNAAEHIPLSAAVSKHKDNLQPSNIGTTEAAYSFLDLVAAFRSANKDDIIQVLKEEDNQNILGALLDIAAAAQTKDTQKALLEVLQFDDSYYIDNPERYILATAFSTHPSEELLQDLLKLYKSDIPSEKLYESIGEALGAMVYTYCKTHVPCNSKIVKETIKTFIENVESCAKPECKPMAIRALANAGVADTIPSLLHHAEHCTDMTVCEAAIKALRRMGKQHMNEEVKKIMRRIFFQTKRGYDTAVRSRALSIILDNDPTYEDIAAILLETRDPHNTEYDVYVQARLFNLMDSDPKIKSMLKEALKDGNISNYHVLAPKGKSLAFTNAMAETSSVTATYFMFLENSRASIIKRSGMDVIAYGQGNTTMLVYGFGIFAAGLEALLGEEVDKEEEDITATAGMSLDLMEVSLRPLTFFTGSGGLMSAVWSAPSEPVSALQINILLTDHVERLHLQNGLIVELNVHSALSLDLSGSLSVSLWNKNSKSLVSNRIALAIRSSTIIKTSPFRAGIQIDSDASSLIDFQTDVDFYDKIKMCLQMSRPESFARRNVTKFEHARGFKKAYIARTRRTKKINALSYPLPKPNNVQCRNMLENS